MPMEKFDAEGVKSLIEKAFPNKPFNGGVIYDGGEKYEDSAMTATRFQGRSWKGFDPKFLRKYSDSVHFFSNEAYVCFLPAFLVAIIDAYDEVDTLVETVVGTLLPVAGDDESSRYKAELFEGRVGLLNDDQRTAVAAFLRHIKETHGETFTDQGEEDALEAYWREYL